VAHVDPPAVGLRLAIVIDVGVAQDVDRGVAMFPFVPVVTPRLLSQFGLGGTPPPFRKASL
jgi:hypothetical protein